MFGLFLGIALYMLFFSKTVVKISVKIITFLKEILCRIFRVILYPFKIIFNTLKRIFIGIYKFIKKTTNNFKKVQNKVKNSKKLEKKEGF